MRRQKAISFLLIVALSITFARRGGLGALLVVGRWHPAVKMSIESSANGDYLRSEPH